MIGVSLEGVSTVPSTACARSTKRPAAKWGWVSEHPMIEPLHHPVPFQTDPAMEAVPSHANDSQTAQPRTNHNG